MSSAHLHIERMVYGGAGVGRRENKPVFVPFTLPEEEVEVRLEREQGGRWDASLLQVLEPSKDRVAPECVHFSVCGGCQYQHAAYPAQLEIKKQILAETLKRSGVHLPEKISAHSAVPYGYRNRIQLRLQREDGKWHIGYSRRSSHQFMAAAMCPIAAPALWQIAQGVETLLLEHSFAQQPLREVEVFCNADGTSVQVSFSLDVVHAEIDRDALSQFRSFCDALHNRFPALAGAGLWVWPVAEQKHRNGKPQHRNAIEIAKWGEPALIYEVSSHPGTYRYEVSRGGFFQVNRELIPELLSIVTDGYNGASAWDLFAGVGLFSTVLAKQFASVIAVEIGERSFETLQKTCNTFGRQHKAIRKDTLAFLQEDARHLPAPDLIVVDPPRAGLGMPVCREIARIEAQQLLYVSCDPTTLSPDLRILLESGYRLAELHLVDLFPQTFHMETVAKLIRA